MKEIEAKKYDHFFESEPIEDDLKKEYNNATVV